MDPIAEMFSQIRNSTAAGKDNFKVPASKVKRAILTVLKEKGIISDYKEDENGKIFQIKAGISLYKIERLSRPGRRVYAKNSDIPRPRTPRNTIIISTSEGIMDGEIARRRGLGGELIAEIK